MTEEVFINDTIETVDTPIDGQGVEAEVVADATEEDIDLFDYTQYADKGVRLQVDGQEVVIPLQEALADTSVKRIIPAKRRNSANKESRFSTLPHSKKPWKRTQQLLCNC
jgi:hypothetical protein